MGVPQRVRLVPEPPPLFLSTYVIEPKNAKGQQSSLFAVASNGTHGDSAHVAHKNGDGGYGNGRFTNGNGGVLDTIVPDAEEPEGKALGAHILKPPPVPRPRLVFV